MDRALAGLSAETYGGVGDRLPVRSPAGPLPFCHLLGLFLPPCSDSENSVTRVVEKAPPVRGPLKPIATVAKRQIVRHPYAGKRYDLLAVHRDLVQRADESKPAAPAQERYPLTIRRKGGGETGCPCAIAGAVRV